MSKTNWQKQDVTHHYLEQVRGGIPFGGDQVKIMLQLIDHFQVNPVRLIDLGCGNGFLGKVLLDYYPDSHAIFIDHSEPMIAEAKINLKVYKDRCEIFHGELNESVLAYANYNSIDCIVSGFAIHHLTHERKRELFHEIYQLLKPGGIFINIEHTKSNTPELEELFENLFIRHLATYNNRSIEEVAMEFGNRPDKNDNILASVEDQLVWLREIGFKHVDCYFKWMELSVFGGVK